MQVQIHFLPLSVPRGGDGDTEAQPYQTSQGSSGGVECWSGSNSWLLPPFFSPRGNNFTPICRWGSRGSGQVILPGSVLRPAWLLATLKGPPRGGGSLAFSSHSCPMPPAAAPHNCFHEPSKRPALPASAVESQYPLGDQRGRHGPTRRLPGWWDWEPCLLFLSALFRPRGRDRRGGQGCSPRPERMWG